jgi:DNA-binding LacI/PurR family transcriptional regulator
MNRYRSSTAEDVAKRAGVSRMTVSSVLNGTGSNVRVSDATRQRVIEAARDLGYRPDPAARALRTRRSRIIGFVPRIDSATPHKEPVADLLRIYIARAAMAHGHHVVEASAETAVSRRSDELSQFLLGWRVDGVIFDSPASEDEVRRFADLGVPVVQLMRPRTGMHTATITVDSSEGIRQAVEHLVQLGHRDIAFIGSGLSHDIDCRRRDQFLRSLADHGVDERDSYLCPDTDASIDHGYAIAQRFLELPQPPTAVFAAGDNLALGALRALYQARLRVPDDVSVVSYDDTFVANLYPPLTSVGQPLDEIAGLAVSLLVESVQAAGSDSDLAGTQLTLPAKLHVRESTSAPPSIARGAPHVAVRGGGAMS